MSLEFHIIIPARYESTRLHGKVLLELEGMTIIERVYRQALKANPKSIIVATDHLKVAEHVKEFGAQVLMTSIHHQTGSDRVAEVVFKQQFAADAIIVNLQGDEPLIKPELIVQVATSLTQSTNAMTTLCWPIESIEQLENPNVVKVVRDIHNNALYFSRAAIPLNRDDSNQFSEAFRHIGLYAYRAAFLLDFVKWPACALESTEVLEQLRILWRGHKIRVDQACFEPLQDINTWEDLVFARQLIKRVKT